MSIPKLESNGATHTVGIAEMTIVQASEGCLITHALGSCIGVTVFDPVAQVGGLLHFMLDQPRSTEHKGDKAAAMFATTGIPELFRLAYAQGAQKERLIVCAAGGADLLNPGGGMQIGRRNLLMMQRLFWKNGVPVAGESTGGGVARTMRLDLSTGTVSLNAAGREEVLWTI
ncbi:MAG: chemotaxis protein CheD [Planctomycetota bacterium]|nr:chemotaxis protein CheD [Planctomycetota bacterium]